MRTTFNSSFINSSSDLSLTAAELAKRQKEVSSGRRINAPSDDPAGVTNAIREHSEMAALDRYAQTADTANARLTAVDSVLSDMVEQLTSAKTTVLAARGTTVTPSQRTAAANALMGIRDAIFSDYTTSFNGTYLFSGQAATVAPYQKMPDGSISAYNGTSTGVRVDVGRETSVQVSFNGDEVARGSDTDDVFTVLSQAIAAVQSGNDADIAAAAQALDRAFGRATTAQTQTGTALNNVETAQGRVADLHRASEARAAALEQVNMADSVTKMSQADTAYRAALGAIGSSGHTSLMDYL
jgi:flagellar hook-associated protein 3 FlgL